MGRPFIDITGKKFGSLTVISKGPKVVVGSMWHCICDCGKEVLAESSAMRLGKKTQCEDCRNLKTSIRSTVHGHSRISGQSPTYISWASMLTRATNPNINAAENYMLRGIKVCARWLNFQNFLEDMGERPEGTSIDRINNNGDYEPSNCRWATRKQQNDNKRAYKRRLK
jgi:hypothetical protein